MNLTEFANKVGAPRENIKQNPLTFGEVVKYSNIPNNDKVEILNSLARISLVNWTWLNPNQ